jgi:hypothetical protein
MAERNTEFAVAVTIPVAIANVLSLYGGTDQDVSLASLPSAPSVGAHTVRIRGTVLITAAPGGPVTVTVKQGQGTGGATVQVPIVNGAAAPVVGQAIPFEVVDVAPSIAANQNGLNYSVCLTTTTSTGTADVTAEIEEVN